MFINSASQVLKCGRLKSGTKKSDNLHHNDVARFKNFQKEILNNLKTLLSIHEKLRKKNVNSEMSVNYLYNIK